MKINGFEKLKRYLKRVRINEGKGYISFHKMKDGTPFAVICTKDYAQAIYDNYGAIESLCSAFFEKKVAEDGKNYLYITSIRSRDKGVGVGREVMNVVKNHAIKNDCDCVKLLSVKAADGFYEKMGFEGADKVDDCTYYLFDLKKLCQREKKVPIMSN